MKVFMLGWEFPPVISGGLGTACYGLTKAMSKLGTKVLFVLPRAESSNPGSHVKLLSAEGHIQSEKHGGLHHVQFKTIPSSLRPYTVPSHTCIPRSEKYPEISYKWHSNPSGHTPIYSHNIFEQVHHYSQKVSEIASVEEFDVVHAHDWMTYPAGIEVANRHNKPLVVHVHSTEFDRSGQNINQAIYDVERRGMHAADKIIAVSHYTKNILTSRYDVASAKVEVVYNAVEKNNGTVFQKLKTNSDKIVLYLGRITMQKGPEYFIAAAKKVLEEIDHVKFVMAGDGDMTNRMIEYAASLGIGHKIMFTRFLRGSDVDRAYQMADLYVMPSVSEPFGIAPLEAIRQGVPVLISKQSGIAEALKHALKVDFWDINEMANKMIAVLRYSPLSETLRQNGSLEIQKFKWEDAAVAVHNIYHKILPKYNQLARSYALSYT